MAGSRISRAVPQASELPRLTRGGQSASAPSIARPVLEAEACFFAEGSPVRIEGMTNRKELNGGLAEIITAEPDELGRVRVQLKSIVPGKVMRVHIERLRPHHGFGSLWIGVPKAKPESHGILNDRSRSLQEFEAFEQRVGLGLPLQPPRPILQASRRGFERTLYGGMLSKRNPAGD
mmetsp:Transcript_3072/g.7869  ORF Transcript_3072/g.7869 Transcript_3072/m.7869 type:complete len:177 (+) Transcript_3072:83-613(+)